MQTPILMVHGMCCTGQVWTQFRSFFEARGARVYTPTLRPEQRVNISQKPPRALSQLGLDDYAADLELEVDRIEAETGFTPAVIGHSMGGLLAQKLAERNRVAAAVLISPAAPGGVHTPVTRVFWAMYALAHRRGLTSPIIRSHQRVLYNMVLNAMPPSERAETEAAMVFESGRVFAEFGNYPIDETKVRVPVLTIAARRDRLVAAAVVRLTGRKYAAVGGEFREYKRHGHWLYAEPGWQEPAGDIYSWLENATRRAHSLRDASAAQQA
jgi:alpha-beta hydrolase superfamily lysophospholipase